MTNNRALQILLAWFVAAAIFVWAGALRLFGPPFPQLVLVSLVLILALAYAFRPSFHKWVNGLPSRPILFLNLTRFIGAYFLVLYDRGELPYAFAVLGGWGDIVVASLALALILVFRGGPPVRSASFQVWNLIGLADILFVVATAARAAAAGSGAMSPLLELPLGLLPTFLVPLLIFTHGVLLLRGTRAERHAT